MAVIFEELCNGGADGVAIDTANTDFSSITGSGTSVFDTDLFIEGGTSILVSPQRQCHATVSGGLFFMSYYAYFVNTPTTTYDVSLALLAGGIRARLRWNTNNLFRLINVSTLVDESTISLVTGQWYRFEWTINSAGGTQQWDIFTGPDLDGLTPTDSLSGAYTTSNVDTLTVGRQASVGTDTNFDRIIIDNATMPPPFSGAATTTVVLDGLFGELTGNFDVTVQADAELNGTLPSLTGSFDVTADVDAELTGALPALEGSFVIVETGAPGMVVLDGVLPSLAGSFEVQASSDIELNGTLPALVGSFDIAEVAAATVTLGGVLPALIGSFEIDAGAPPPTTEVWTTGMRRSGPRRSGVTRTG